MNIERPRFQSQGSCVGVNPDLFYPARGDTPTQEAAKAICATCPVREECLEYALSKPEMFGIWGGMSESARGRLRRKRRAEDRRLARRECRRHECDVIFAPATDQEAYCSDECRQATKNDKARRRRAA